MSLNRRYAKGLFTALAAGFLTLACSGDVTPTASQPALPTPTADVAAVPVPALATPTPTAAPTLAPTDTAVPRDPTPTPTPTLRDIEDRYNHPFYEYSWGTDFSKNSVPFQEIRLLLQRDAIPPIYKPEFDTVEEARQIYVDLVPVIVVEINGDARAYPEGILSTHEVVNDVVGGVPIAVTWCPLCNTALVFDRNVDGRAFRFGVSGLLRDSNLIMWDWETESWWQQGTLEAIVGKMTGTQLKVVAFQVVSLRDFMETFPDGKVLHDPDDLDGDYNPYYEYDTDEKPFLFKGDLDTRLSAGERVIGVQLGGEVRAYPFPELTKDRVVHERVGGQDIVILYEPTTVSALDRGKVSISRAVGAATVFIPRIGDRELTLEYRDGAFVDVQTESTWNILGHAVDGPLTGERLPPLFHHESLWFYWAATFESTTIYSSTG